VAVNFVMSSFLKSSFINIRTIWRRHSHRISRNQLMCKTPVQTIDDIRYRTSILLKDPECESISWVGLYGSFARSTHSVESDVDLIIGYKPESEADKIFQAAGNIVGTAKEAFGRQVEFVHLMTQEVSTYLLLEALLTCVTVYGPEEWPHSLQQQARKFLDDGYGHLKDAHLSLRRIRGLVAKTDRQVLIQAN
jgi:predicted nucleotidyltransferase